MYQCSSIPRVAGVNLYHPHKFHASYRIPRVAGVNLTVRIIPDKINSIPRVAGVNLGAVGITPL